MTAILSATGGTREVQREWKIKAEVSVKSPSSLWSRWYENRGPQNLDLLLSPTFKARQQWEITLSKLRLSARDLEVQRSINSPLEFLEYVKQLEGKHEAKRKTRTRDKVLNNLVSFEKFTSTYSPVVDAIKRADPSGAADVIWSLCSVAVTFIASKQLTDSLIHESITALEKSLPRLTGYGDLYPTDRMMALIGELYAQVMDFLPKVFLYYRRFGWKGSLIFAASDDTFSKFLGNIDQTSRAIFEEGAIGMSSEVRTLHLIMQDTQKETCKLRNDHQQNSRAVAQDLESITTKLERTHLKVDDMETTKRQKALGRVKRHLVHGDYVPDQVWAAASNQISYGLPQGTRQNQACQVMMSRDPLASWLSCALKPSDGIKKIIWINSSGTADLSVSHLALRTVDALRKLLNEPSEKSPITEGPPLILHSMHQTKLPNLACTETKRTASTLLAEAVYQLLAHNSSLVLEHAILKSRADGALGPTRLTLEELGTLMSDLLDQYSSSNSEAMIQRTTGLGPRCQPGHLPQPIYWIIDRIDECVFNYHREASKLYDLMKMLDRLVTGPRSRLRVLITSLCPPERCDPRWASSVEDDESCLKSLVEEKMGSTRARRP